MKISALLTIVVIAALPAVAAAQGSVEGRGFPIGEKSRIHTNLDVGVGFDSNPERAPTEASEWKAQFRPQLEVDVPGNSLRFNLHSQLLIEQFFGTNVISDTRVGGDIGVDLRAGSSKSAVGLELRDTVTRTPDFVSVVGAVGVDEIAFPQWYNRGLANIVLRPGGGALEFRLGYGNELKLFDTLPQAQTHTANFEAKWKFFPKTAAIFAADIGFFSANTPAKFTPTNKASPYNIAIGLQGQVTPKLSTMLRVGFGDTLSWEGDYFSTVSNANIRTIIAGVMFSYAFIPGSSFTIGYERQVKPVILLDSYVSDSPYAKLQLAVGTRLIFGLYGSLEFRDYSGDAGDRQARLALLDARIEYWFFEFLRGGIAYQLLNQSVTQAATTTGGNDLLADFTRHQGLLMVGVYY